MTDWTEEQQALREGLARWCGQLSDGHLERDKTSAFDPRVWKSVRASGILGLPFEERWGGLGQDLPTTMYVLEELGHSCRDAGLSFSIGTQIVSAGIPLQRFGSTPLKERYLPSIIEGEAVTGHAISEPDSGSDALTMRTRARRDGDRWILDGSKSFVTNAPIADLITVYARTGRDDGPMGITAFLVERDTPGLTVGRPLEKMGLKSSPTAELFFDGCVVPDANVVGRAGSGFLVMDYVMKWEILLSFIINVGEMQHRLERCLEYSKQRHQFGKPIGSFQAVANKLVEMKIGVETSRLWLYRTARRFQNKQDVVGDIAISKLLTSEANLSSALSAVQLFGGNGYMAETGVEKELRDAVGGTIYSGTSDIQRNRIAAMLGL